MKLSLDKIFYKIVYHHIIYMCDFFVNLDDFFVVVCTNFHESLVSTRYVPKVKLLISNQTLSNCTICWCAQKLILESDKLFGGEFS